jgi:hypothetical protein
VAVVIGLITNLTLEPLYKPNPWLTVGWSSGLIILHAERKVELISWPTSVLGYGLFLGISGALLIFLLTGGLAVWRHYSTRFLLQRSRRFPWKAPQFLDDATARFLLRRVGGGYSFTHRLLLDHFADAPEPLEN